MIAEAECVPNTKAAWASSIGETMSLRRGKAGSCMEGNHRNMRGPSGAAGLVSAGDSGKALPELLSELSRESDWFLSHEAVEGNETRGKKGPA